MPYLPDCQHVVAVVGVLLLTSVTGAAAPFQEPVVAAGKAVSSPEAAPGRGASKADPPQTGFPIGGDLTHDAVESGETGVEPTVGLVVGAGEPRPPSATSPSGALARVGERDPFAMTDRMRAEAKAATPEPGFLPAPDQTPVPDLRLKGYVEGRNQTVVALVEVSGRETYVVREGDVLSVLAAGSSLVIKIIQVSRNRVSVQIGTLDHVVVVR